MTTAAFDSLRAARDIEAAGLKRAQAEAIAEAIQRRNEHSATNADISGLRGDFAGMKGNIAVIEGDIVAMKGDIAGMKGNIAVIEGEIAGIKTTVARLEISISQLRNWFVSGLVTILVAIVATAFLPG